MRYLGKDKKERSTHGRAYTYGYYECRCGNKTWRIKSKVNSGHVKSCGCMAVINKNTIENQSVKKISLRKGTKERQELLRRLKIWASTFTGKAA